MNIYRIRYNDCNLLFMLPFYKDYCNGLQDLPDMLFNNGILTEKEKYLVQATSDIISTLESDFGIRFTDSNFHSYVKLFHEDIKLVYAPEDGDGDDYYQENWKSIWWINALTQQEIIDAGVTVIRLTFADYAKKFPLPPTNVYIFTETDCYEVYLDNWIDFDLEYDLMSRAEASARNYQPVLITREDYTKMFGEEPE